MLNRELCIGCGQRDADYEGYCVLCIKENEKRRKIKILGGLIVIGGLVIAVPLALYIVSTDEAQVRNSPKPDQLKLMLSVAYGLLAFGAVSVGVGIVHIITGKLYLNVIKVLYVSVFVIAALARFLL